MKAMLSSLLVMMMVGTAQADPLTLKEAISKVPLKQGIAYSFVDDKINYLSTTEVAKWKNITLEFGYAGAASETGHKLVSVISYPIIKLKDYIDVPVLDLIEANIGIYGGLGKIQFGGDTSNDNKFDSGITMTLMKIKF